MDRLRLSPSYLPLRTCLLCAFVAVMLLCVCGDSAGDVLEFLVGVLPVGPEAESVLRVLVERAAPSFLLISLALLMGMSFALACAIVASSLGGRMSRLLGWVGRALVGVPPMMWALAVIFGVVSLLRLPVETLFPYEPPSGEEPFWVGVGRSAWAWLVPATVLAVPVFGTALFSFTHRLSVLKKDPMIWPVKSRGLSDKAILYRHLVTELRVHLARLTRPCAALLLAFAIPVEMIFKFEGWGSFAAEALKFQRPLPLAAVVYLAGIMLSVWYSLVNLADKRSLPPSMEHAEDEEQTQSWFCVALGLGLIAGLSCLGFFLPPQSPWLPAQKAAFGEVGGMLLLSLAATAGILVSGLAVAPLRWRRSVPRTNIIATWSAGPLLLFWLVLSDLPALEPLSLALLGLASAVPGIAAFRDTFREKNAILLAEATRALGRRHWGYWRDHVLLNALPSLLNWMLRNVATLLVWKGTHDYLAWECAGSAAEDASWGGLMARNAGRLLDDPAAALAPAVLMMFWCLSFRLLSRAFRTDTPPVRTSPFAS